MCLVLCINFGMEDARLSCGETDRHLKVGSGEHISIFPLTFKKVKLSAKSSIRDICNHNPSFDDFTILAQGTNKFLLEIKESLLIKLDKPILKTKASVLLHFFLFDKVHYDWIISIIINCIFCHGVFTLKNMYFFV